MAVKTMRGNYVRKKKLDSFHRNALINSQTNYSSFSSARFVCVCGEGERGGFLSAIFYILTLRCKERSVFMNKDRQTDRHTHSHTHFLGQRKTFELYICKQCLCKRRYTRRRCACCCLVSRRLRCYTLQALSLYKLFFK